MKILFISLARIGDIYQSWPSLRAFARKNPDCEFHVLTRKKFQNAFEGIEIPLRFHILPNDLILEDYLRNQKIENSKALMQNFLNGLCEKKFDQVINLTFSPLSASITAFLGVPDSRGFSRHFDLSLKIQDDWSAYFYAQVGVAKWNRIHMLEFYANFLGVQLESEDFQDLRVRETPYRFQSYLVIHIGASRADKNLTPQQWGYALQLLLEEMPYQLVILGTEKEVIPFLPSHPRLRNLIGETNLGDIFELIKNCELFIGPDSSLLQVANLLQKKSFNLSFSTVRFWESGPKAKTSFVVRVSAFRQLEEIVGEIKKCLLNLTPGLHSYVVDPETDAYRGTTSIDEDEAWALICAIYFQLPLHSPLNPTTRSGIQKINQANDVAIELLAQIKSVQDLESLKHLLDVTDQALVKIKKIVPQLSPIVDWLMTERVRISPDPVQRIDTVLVAETYKRHMQLKNFLIQYGLVETDPIHDGVANESDILPSRSQG